MKDNWKKFLTDVYKFLSSYDIQSEREVYNVQNISDWGSRGKPQGLYISNNFQEFLAILEMNDIDTKGVKNENYQPYLKEINEIVMSTLKQKPGVTCRDKIPVVEGDLVTISQTSFGKVCSMENSTGLHQVKIFASDTIYLDADWYFFSPNFALTLMAPKIVIKNWRNIGFKDNTSRFLIAGEMVNGDQLTIHNGQTNILGQPRAVNLGNEEIDQLLEFKTFLRKSLQRATWIRKPEIKLFLEKLHNTEIIRNYKFDNLIAEYMALEKQFTTCWQQHVDLFSSYSDLLGVLSKKLETERYTNDEKIVLYHVYTSLLTKLNIVERNIVETGIVVKVEYYLKVKIDQFERYKQYRVEEIIQDSMYINIEGLNSMIKDGKNVIQNYILSDNIQSNVTHQESFENVLDTNTSKILDAIAKLLDQLGDLGLLVNQILTETNQVLDHLSIISIEKKGIRPEIKSIKDLISKIKFEELPSLRGDVVALVAQITDDTNLLEKKSTTSSASLDVTRWQVPRLLKRAKYYVKQLPKNSTSNTLESLNTFINIYQRIESFYWQKKIADFIAPLYLTDWDKKVNNTNLTGTVKEVKETIICNLLVSKYENDVDVVKQYTFPYFDEIVSHYKLVPFMLQRRNATEMIENCKGSLDLLVTNLFSSLAPMREYKWTTNGYQYDQPLAVWNHTEHSKDFGKLFSGEEILLKADIQKSSTSENGLRFRNIEMHFNAVNQTQQDQINKILDFFQIELTHSGNSYYRCGNKTYLITTQEVPLVYSHEVHNDRRVMRNSVYVKIESGDGILSPYTTWRLRLKERRGNTEEHIDSLRKLATSVDLHLVAYQNYLTNDPVVCDRDIDSYYDLDEPFSLIESPANTRIKRFVDDRSGPGSAASTIYSPINGFMSGAITRINHLGGFALKTIGLAQESYLAPRLFYDQVNSMLILAPILIFLGTNFLTKTSTVSEHKIQISRTKIWASTIRNLQTIVMKYKIEVAWLKRALEDKTEDIALVQNEEQALDLEMDLVSILVDFLDDVQFDPGFEKIKFDKNFLSDVNSLIDLCTGIPSFAKKLSLL